MKKNLFDVQVREKVVFVRVDFNVPLKEQSVMDDTRIVEALPTIRYLLSQKAKIVLLSHLGKVDHQNEQQMKKDMIKNDLRYLIPILTKHLQQPVQFISNSRGLDVKKLQPRDIVLLQNTRYEAQEEANGEELAELWAKQADVFVMDAFGTAHRKHASTYGLPKKMNELHKQTAIGFLVEKEVDALSRCVHNVARPYVAILGGAKVSSKIKVLDVLLEKVDKVIIGGAMAHTFLAAMGVEVGNARIEPNQFDYVKACLAKAGQKIFITKDHIMTDSFDNPTFAKVSLDERVEPGLMPLDIGPKTQSYFSKQLQGAKTIFWNGPMGVFENPLFEEGTKAICKSVVELQNAFSVIGGGDSAAASAQFGYKDGFSHVSTGGGASLEMIENDGHLPGIDIIQERQELL